MTTVRLPHRQLGLFQPIIFVTTPRMCVRSNRTHNCSGRAYKGESKKDTNSNNNIPNNPPSAMKSTLILTAISLLVAAVHGCATEGATKAADGYVQNPSGTASFTQYSGCGTPGKQRESHSTRAHTLSTVPPQRVENLPPASQPR